MDQNYNQKTKKTTESNQAPGRMVDGAKRRENSRESGSSGRYNNIQATRNQTQADFDNTPPPPPKNPSPAVWEEVGGRRLRDGEGNLSDRILEGRRRRTEGEEKKKGWYGKPEDERRINQIRGERYGASPPQLTSADMLPAAKPQPPARRRSGGRRGRRSIEAAATAAAGSTQYRDASTETPSVETVGGVVGRRHRGDGEGKEEEEGGGRGNRRSCASPLVGAVRFSFYAREARTFTPVAVDVI